MTTNEADWSEDPCYKQDPLPDIEPALLNSRDIKRYVDKGCLLEAETFDSEQMKLASYEMRFLGDLYDWKEVGSRLQERCRTVCDGDTVTLSKNSISYLWTKEQLRLPEYIAARFNLRISDVHKGILLGTGPLIDPGFRGRLLIPLHNLTDNDYVFTGGKGIIWVEFTKVSKNCYWQAGQEETKRPDGLREFPRRKVIDDPHGYLKKAGVLAAGGVQSAFKGELDRTTRVAKGAETASQDAQSRVSKLEGSVRSWGLGGLFVGVLAVAGLVLSAYSLTFPVMEKVHSQGERIAELEDQLEHMVEAGPKRPDAMAAEDPNSATESTEQTAAEAAKRVQEAEIPIETETSPDSEIPQ